MAIQTKIVEYPNNGEEAYKAMVKDITAMYDWDETVENEEKTSTSFRKNAANTAGYTGICVGKTSYRPKLWLIGSTGENTYSYDVPGSGGTSAGRYVAYAYNADVFAFCAAANQLPETSASSFYFCGVSTSKNIKTSKTGYCSFCGNSIRHFFFSEENLQS